MRCYICDVELTEGEISLDKRMQSNPCTSCNQIIYETAFSGKFKTAAYSVASDDEDEFGDDFEPDDLRFAEMIEEDMYGPEN
jgi:hypothetical protein